MIRRLIDWLIGSDVPPPIPYVAKPGEPDPDNYDA